MQLSQISSDVRRKNLIKVGFRLSLNAKTSILDKEYISYSSKLIRNMQYLLKKKSSNPRISLPENLITS